MENQLWKDKVGHYALPGLIKGTTINLKPVLTQTKIEDILDVVSEITKVDKDKIKSGGRKHEYVEARQIFCGLARKYTKASLKTIGEYIGNKDHTTVISSVKTFKNVHDVDADFRELVRRIEINIV